MQLIWYLRTSADDRELGSVFLRIGLYRRIFFTEGRLGRWFMDLHFAVDPRARETPSGGSFRFSCVEEE
jgi:hypothetical protein